MPYVSDKQRRYMHAVHPAIAARWDREMREKIARRGRLAYRHPRKKK